MYPSNSSCNHNPTSFTSFDGQVIQHRSLFNNDINLSSKLDVPLSSASLSHFPSQSMLYENAVNELIWQQLDDLFVQQQSLTAAETLRNMADLKKDAVNEGITEQITRKRSSKKDRHSKINTAHGPRDRRMRLSLEVARKFFDLQDMLGFDKASKTVEWLLIQSSSAIKEITGGMPRMRHSCSVGANSVSSTSECEGVSGIDESTTTENPQARISIKLKIKSSCNKEKKAKLARQTAFHRIHRESRKIARERARKRTIEKKRLGESKSCFEAMDTSDLNRLGTWSHFETGEESGSQGPKLNHSSYEGLTEVEGLSCRDQHLLGTIEYVAEDPLVITGNWNTSTICNFQQNAEISHDQHHFAHFDQYCSKPWQACNLNLGG